MFSADDRPCLVKDCQHQAPRWGKLLTREGWGPNLPNTAWEQLTWVSGEQRLYFPAQAPDQLGINIFIFQDNIFRIIFVFVANKDIKNHRDLVAPVINISVLDRKAMMRIYLAREHSHKEECNTLLSKI